MGRYMVDQEIDMEDIGLNKCIKCAPKRTGTVNET